jgi:hypothetical protein
VLLSVLAQSDDGSVTIQLLTDIRTVVVRKGIGRMHSKPPRELLAEMEDKPWGDWKNGYPISRYQLTRLLNRHQIHLRAWQEIRESTFERVKYGFTTMCSYHMLWW